MNITNDTMKVFLSRTSLHILFAIILIHVGEAVASSNVTNTTAGKNILQIFDLMLSVEILSSNIRVMWA